MVRIGLQPEQKATPLAINSDGFVVGSSDANDGAFHAFIYDSNSNHMQVLDELTGLRNNAKAINNAGKVVIDSETQNEEFSSFLFELATGSIIRLETARIARRVDLKGINDHDQIAGVSLDFELPAHSFIFDLNTLEVHRIYGPMQSACFASAINNSGLIVGYTQTDSGMCAFLFEQDYGLRLLQLPAEESFAFNISEGGLVVGYVRTGNRFQGFLYNKSNEEFQFLGTLGGMNSFARAINSNGQIVGCSQSPTDGQMHAFMFVENAMLDLNDSLLSAEFPLLVDAVAINDKGLIVCITEEQKACLLFPTS